MVLDALTRQEQPRGQAHGRLTGRDALEDARVELGEDAVAVDDDGVGLFALLRVHDDDELHQVAVRVVDGDAGDVAGEDGVARADAGQVLDEALAAALDETVELLAHRAVHAGVQQLVEAAAEQGLAGVPELGHEVVVGLDDAQLEVETRETETGALQQ